jgi:hypothetical protein
VVILAQQLAQMEVQAAAVEQMERLLVARVIHRLQAHLKEIMVVLLAPLIFIWVVVVVLLL